MSRPLQHPFSVLAVALVLPGVGQVVNGQPRRGLVFVFYILLLGLVTRQVAPDSATDIGRYAGGIFVYAISVFDAYTVAAQQRHRPVSPQIGRINCHG